MAIVIYLFIPFLVAMPLLWVIGLGVPVKPIDRSIIGLGVGGWLVDSALRGPVTRIVRLLHLSDEKSQDVVGAASVPAGVITFLLGLAGFDWL